MGRGHKYPQLAYYLSDTDIVRLSERQHPVQGRGSDCNLGRLGPFGARSKGVASACSGLLGTRYGTA
jgi:hypothetical protein